MIYHSWHVQPKLSSLFTLLSTSADQSCQDKYLLSCLVFPRRGSKDNYSSFLRSTSAFKIFDSPAIIFDFQYISIHTSKMPQCCWNIHIQSEMKRIHTALMPISDLLCPKRLGCRMTSKQLSTANLATAIPMNSTSSSLNPRFHSGCQEKYVISTTTTPLISIAHPSSNKRWYTSILPTSTAPSTATTRASGRNGPSAPASRTQ